MTDYLEGALPPHRAERLEEHLSRCRGCTAHLTGMRRTLELLGSIPEDGVPSEVRTSLLDAFRDWPGGGRGAV